MFTVVILNMRIYSHYVSSPLNKLEYMNNLKMKTQYINTSFML